MEILREYRGNAKDILRVLSEIAGEAERFIELSYTREEIFVSDRARVAREAALGQDSREASSVVQSGGRARFRFFGSCLGLRLHICLVNSNEFESGA